MYMLCIYDSESKRLSSRSKRPIPRATNFGTCRPVRCLGIEVRKEGFGALKSNLVGGLSMDNLWLVTVSIWIYGKYMVNICVFSIKIWFMSGLYLVSKWIIYDILWKYMI